MTVIDRDGRLFGRINVFDAAIGAFVVLLIPITYAALMLFRPPRPDISAVESAPLTFTEERAAGGSQLSGKLKVRGAGLRPVLRAEIGGQPALAYIFESPSSADVLYGDITPGVHDLVLYDGVQEVARAQRAVTIPEKPAAIAARVHAVGTFLDLDQPAAQALRVGAKLPDANQALIEIIALGDAEPAQYLVNGKTQATVSGRWQRPVVAAVRCQMSALQPTECRTTGIVVAPGFVLSIPGPAQVLRFQIAEVVPASPPEMSELRVRFLGYPSVLDLVKVGDRDRPEWALDGRSAVISSLGARRMVSGQVSIGLMAEGAAPSAGIEASDQVGALDAVLRLGLDRTRSSLRYRSDVVRVGAPIAFSTASYTIRGVVLSVHTDAAQTSTAGETR